MTLQLLQKFASLSDLPNINLGMVTIQPLINGGILVVDYLDPQVRREGCWPAERGHGSWPITSA